MQTSQCFLENMSGCANAEIEDLKFESASTVISIYGNFSQSNQGHQYIVSESKKKCYKSPLKPFKQNKTKSQPTPFRKGGNRFLKFKGNIGWGSTYVINDYSAGISIVDRVNESSEIQNSSTVSFILIQHLFFAITL